MSLSEAKIISVIKEQLKPILAPGAQELLDDCALLPPVLPGFHRVISQDAFQEKNDFQIGLGPLESAGYRAIIQNLSDIAAAGGTPIGFLWSLEIPESWFQNDLAFLTAFLKGAVAASQSHGVQFYGGDLSRSALHFSCSITIFGDVKGKPLGRQGARPGDRIYVSRPLGASAAGLKNLLDGIDGPANPIHLYPTAELELGPKLVDIATACMDLSDGLSKDLHTLCSASKVGARVHTLPKHSLASADQALLGGEDYALLFTAQDSPYGIEIGEIVADTNEMPWSNCGYDHFR
ncbi:MAG: hypothetical protein I8H75_05975 [Myxococcaceae bacterium]|nr:hypothetical protein [Myxococcaceae bacterium]